MHAGWGAIICRQLPNCHQFAPRAGTTGGCTNDATERTMRGLRGLLSRRRACTFGRATFRRHVAHAHATCRLHVGTSGPWLNNPLTCLLTSRGYVCVTPGCGASCGTLQGQVLGVGKPPSMCCAAHTAPSPHTFTLQAPQHVYPVRSRAVTRTDSDHQWFKHHAQSWGAALAPAVALRCPGAAHWQRCHSHGCLGWCVSC